MLAENSYTFSLIDSTNNKQDKVLKVKLYNEVIFSVDVEHATHNWLCDECFMMIGMVELSACWTQYMCNKTGLHLSEPMDDVNYYIKFEIRDDRKYIVIEEGSDGAPTFIFSIPFDKCDKSSFAQVFKEIAVFKDVSLESGEKEEEETEQPNEIFYPSQHRAKYADYG